MFFTSHTKNKNVLVEKKTCKKIKLIYLGKELNINQEHNLLSKNKYGFKVTIVYNLNSAVGAYEGERLIEIRHNCTQVHYGYTEMGFVKPLTKVAFETDIFHTGSNRKIKDLESIVIELETKKHSDFYEYPKYPNV